MGHLPCCQCYRILIRAELAHIDTGRNSIRGMGDPEIVLACGGCGESQNEVTGIIPCGGTAYLEPCAGVGDIIKPVKDALR